MAAQSSMLVSVAMASVCTCARNMRHNKRRMLKLAWVLCSVRWSNMTVEWLEIPGYIPKTHNPIHGCTPVSEGCAHCWAKQMAETRLRGKAGYPQDEPFRVAVDAQKFDDPRKWKKPHTIFWVDMGDLFHEHVGELWHLRAMDVVRDTPQHLHFFLTKRPQRMKCFFECYAGSYIIPDNLWIGVSVENQKRADERIPVLLRTPAKHRFLSLEPLLWGLDIMHYLERGLISWIIVGGESGKDCRPMHEEWAVYVGDQCRAAGVPFYLKQLGGHPDPRHRDKALLLGKLWKEFPNVG